MKKLTILFLALLCCHVLSAAWSSHIQEFKTYKLAELLPDGDGYYAIGKYTREEMQPNNTLVFQYTFALMRLDARLNIVWEKPFPETSMHPYFGLIAVGDVLYLGGTEFDAEFNETPRLLCFDRQGNQLWIKRFRYPGCTNGSKLVVKRALPGDDLLLGYRGGGCNPSRCIVADARVKTTGEIVWVKDTYAALGKFGGYGSNFDLENGDYLRFDHTMVGPGPDGRGIYDLFVQCVDIESGAINWSKKSRLPGDFRPNGVMRLRNGHYMLTGDFIDVSSGVAVEKSMRAIVGPDGQLLDAHVWTEGFSMQNACLMRLKDGFYYSCVRVKESIYGKTWLSVYKYDSDGQLVDSSRIDTDMLGMLRDVAGGGYMIWNQDRVMWLEEA